MSGGSFGGFKKEYIGVATSDALDFNSKFTPTVTIDAATKKYTDDVFAGLAQPPAGNNTEVQYNDGGNFGADAAFTYTSGTGTVNVTNVTATSDATATDITATGTLTANNVLPTTSFVSTSSLAPSGAASGPTFTVTTTNAASASGGTELSGTFTATSTLTSADAEVSNRLIIGPSALDPADLISVNQTEGVLPPRMSSGQRNAIASPAPGLVVYDTSENRLYYYNGSGWVRMYEVPDPSFSTSVTFPSVATQAVTTGSVVIYPTIDTNVDPGAGLGSVAYNNGTGVFTVTSPFLLVTTVVLTAVTHVSSSTNIPEFAWCDGGGTPLSGARSFVTSVTAATDNSSSSTTQSMYNIPFGTTSQTFSFRCVFVAAGINVSGGSHASVIQIL